MTAAGTTRLAVGCNGDRPGKDAVRLVSSTSRAFGTEPEVVLVPRPDPTEEDAS